MTVNDFRVHAANSLSSICETPKFEADQMIMFALDITKNDLLLARHQKLSDTQIAKLTNLLKRRLSREPLQYICGEWEFFGLKMFCGKGCLIPRPETEMLVEYAIKHLTEGARMLDLCTGSGCIAVSILKNRTDITATAVDISEDALFYARKNAQFHCISPDRLDFVCNDIRTFSPSVSPDFIVSNPPYIKSNDISELSPEVQKEPYIALDGGNDGLKYYKVIAEKYGSVLNSGGHIAMEIGYDIADEVYDIFKIAGFKTEIITDVFGNNRMCVAIKY